MGFERRLARRRKHWAAVGPRADILQSKRLVEELLSCRLPIITRADSICIKRNDHYDHIRNTCTQSSIGMKASHGRDDNGLRQSVFNGPTRAVSVRAHHIGRSPGWDMLGR